MVVSRLGIIATMVAASLGCSSEKAPAPTNGLEASVPSDDSATTFDSTPDSTSGSDATSDATDEAASDAKSDGKAESGVPEVCTVPFVAFGTKLVAGGVTPDAFATAFNDEMSKTSAGALLLVFKGTDSKDKTKWKLRLGPVQASGGGFEFGGATGEIAYDLGIGLAATASALVDTKMHFASATTTADVPIVAFDITGNLGGCEELGVDSLKLAIPASAASMAFHGSTIGALMGAPITSDAGPSVYLLELLGSAPKVTFSGGTP